jgi:2-hydroxychromene-2-carboxylate isomerase
MGVPFKRPEPFPQPSLLPARVAFALEGDKRSDFSRRVYAAEFGDGLPIGERATLGALLAAGGVDPAAAFERAESDANKALLKAECARAAAIGIIGAPCLVTEDREVFWGNDRLEQGLAWAARARAGKVL